MRLPAFELKWRSYLVAILIIAGASVIRVVFFGGLGRGTAYLTYYPTVMLATLCGGLHSGLLATAIAALLCFFWIQKGYMSPVESMAIGSVMILEEPKRDAFVIEASIGLGNIAKKGDRVSVTNSLAKHAIINKTPLLVEDIETDIRFGRPSKPQYSTKSFICMPLKTMNDVIGVLNMSQRKTEKPFSQKE